MSRSINIWQSKKLPDKQIQQSHAYLQRSKTTGLAGVKLTRSHGDNSMLHTKYSIILIVFQ